MVAYPRGETSSPSVVAAIALGYSLSVAQAFLPRPGLPLALAGVVLIVALGRYVGASRAERRTRVVALAVAIVWAMLMGGEELARTLNSGARLDHLLLVTYQATIAVAAIVLTVGLRSTWADRVLVTDLVVELGAAQTDGVRGELAAVLGDPELEVGYWVDGTGYVDTQGRLLDMDHDADTRSVLPIERDGQPVAVLVHRATPLSDPLVVDAVAAAALLVTTNVRLQTEVLGWVADVKASRRRIVEAADGQRARLELRVREGAMSRLGELSAVLDQARVSSGSHEVSLRIDEARSQLSRAEQDLRQLARGIHPHQLAQRGLVAVLTDLAAESPLPVAVEALGPVDQAPHVLAAAAYFVCSESLANAVKHSGASGATLTVEVLSEELLVQVADNGIGGADATGGTGLQGLVDRVAALGGTLEVVSPPGGGTRLVARIPRSRPGGAG
jgi:signal transduction histidine kinase